MTILKFRPYLKSVIWGGDKICSYKGIRQPEPNIGESWEISAVKGHESIVSEGPHSGKSLTELSLEHGADLLGSRVVDRYGPNFPILIKFIDAADNLSVQVHPDDTLALHRHGSLGKTEMWYIIDTDDKAKIYAGLNTEMTPDEYVRRVADGSFAKTIAAHESNPGDVFFLPAGTVHAIGAGNLLAEIQESSDVTYRIYDYDRRDAYGNPRELHTELAKDAIDYRTDSNSRTPCPDRNLKECALVECDHFNVRRLIVDGKREISVGPESFAVLICIEGNANVNRQDAHASLRRGETCLIAAKAGNASVEGNATLLFVTC